MDILKTLLLGIIQGLTEFLPVSSSGHLIIAQTFMGGSPEPEAGSAMFLEVMLHVATGIAVLFVFRKDIVNIIRGYFSRNSVERKDSLSYSGYVILATIPAALVGILLNNQIDALFDTSKGNTAAYIASFMLFVTAALLIFSSNGINKHSINTDGRDVNNTAGINGGMTAVRALLIGVTQAIAIMPGISRSGSTIAVALIIGVAREEAGRFSFMLALPAIFGAALLQARHIESWGKLVSIDIIAGFIASLVVGVIALKFLLTFIKKGMLHYFGYYCAAAAVVSIAALTFIRR
ncbi:MAG: undecaprenyl-diphosphate phosphatase [Chitinispirillales bacterium]|jgi:undecaprenyl-diphosphatase|nr:undecaprenyl-diphosphate phosphatase [Chitinispirillales bacterium]